MPTRLGCLVGLLWLGLTVSITDAGLAAHWDFDEGKGSVVHDGSGNGHDGKIVNAEWVKTKDGHALKFGESGSYVDFGKCPDLDITGEATIIAWVKPMASYFKTRMTNYEILSCESYPNSGYIIRLDGTSSRPYYRASHSKQVNSMSYYYARDPLENHTFHHVALVITKNPTTDRRYEYKGTFYLDGVQDNGMLLYNSPAAASAAFTVSGKGLSLPPPPEEGRRAAARIPRGSAVSDSSRSSASMTARYSSVPIFGASGRRRRATRFPWNSAGPARNRSKSCRSKACRRRGSPR